MKHENESLIAHTNFVATFKCGRYTIIGKFIPVKIWPMIIWLIIYTNVVPPPPRLYNQHIIKLAYWYIIHYRSQYVLQFDILSFHARCVLPKWLILYAILISGNDTYFHVCRIKWLLKLVCWQSGYQFKTYRSLMTTQYASDKGLVIWVYIEMT